MGILSLLFGRKPVPEPTEAAASGAAGFGFGPQFATPEPIVREAFDQITAEMELPTPLRDAFRDAFARGDKAGDTRAQEQLVIGNLLGSDWRWPTFDLWAKRFGDQRQWPYMWHSIDNLLDLGPDIPEGIEESVAVLKVAEMKEMLRDRGALPKPTPRKREEVVALVRQHYADADLLAIARQRAIEQYRSPTAEEIEIAKCKLLTHTITMRAYALRDSHDRDRLARNGFPESADVVALTSDDPVEDAIVAQFNQGKLRGLPPFFPGDRMCLISRSAFERSRQRLSPGTGGPE